jgi:hypothetical protein
MAWPSEYARRASGTDNGFNWNIYNRPNPLAPGLKTLSSGVENVPSIFEILIIIYIKQIVKFAKRIENGVVCVG